MTKVTYYVATSLDGFIAATDDNLDWLDVPDADGNDFGYADFFESVDGLVMGRKTFDIVRAFGTWHYGDKPAWVFSRSSLGSHEFPVQSANESAEAFLERPDVRQVRKLWLVGGADLAAAFREIGRIDEIVVSIIPIVLGRGLPLFKGGEARDSMRLVSSRQYVGGVVQNVYNRPGK